MSAPYHRNPTPADCPVAKRGGFGKSATLSKRRGLGLTWDDVTLRKPGTENCKTCGLTGDHECIDSIYKVASLRPGPG